MEQSELTDEQLRVIARTAIKVGTLPMPDQGTIQGPLGHIQIPIYCIVCGGYMRQGQIPIELTNLPDQPLMHYVVL